MELIILHKVVIVFNEIMNVTGCLLKAFTKWYIVLLSAIIRMIELEAL